MADLFKNVTVLGAKRMDFKNGDDVIQGVQVWSYAEISDDENTKGIIPTKSWMPLLSFETYENVEEFPAVARCGYTIDMAKNKLKPVSFEFAKK